jgi:hypothetical protein
VPLHIGWSDTENMRAVLKWAFLFQLNPEILSLECTQNVDFVKRWRSLMTLPGILGFIAGIAMLAYFVFYGGAVCTSWTQLDPYHSL